ncbi:serine/threonine-protein kinase [Glaciimonas soli]|uniref:Protein kinase n=1 Tax=Glaciimonas soli TaxID=2590999 RepID=A0A843YML8_9BURK|nr:serine/threonine-protein kinase [Glaciimonas soli]MQR00705.1 protein kinase [Glaciimonas soli]
MAEAQSIDNPIAVKHYQIHGRLGEGGFAHVYEAWDSKLCRSVAIKRLKNIDGVSNAKDMLREARLSSSLKHAAFVKIHALEEDDNDTASIVMELVPGRSLKQLLAEAPVSELQALQIVQATAEAMCEAHDSGLTHGDLKLSNLMIEPSGTLRILDFGLAVHSDQQVTITLQQADPQGTIAYMAPERLRGAALSPQCDIYALGVVLYELATATRPFPHLSGLALAAAHLQSSSEQWHYPVTMHAQLIGLIHRMTAYSSEQRLQSMRETHSQIVEVVKALQSDSSTTSAPTALMPTVSAPLPPVSKNTPLSRLGRKLPLAIALTIALAGGVWLASPYASYWLTLVTPKAPFSEALEMKQGLAALQAWDRPGELDDAETKFTTVLQHDSSNAAAVAGLSQVYSLRYKNDNLDDTWRQKAAAAAQQALKLNDQLALSHVAYGNALFNEGKIEDASAAYEHALNLDPTNLFGLLAKAQSLDKLHRPNEALAAAQKDLQDYPHERAFADLIGTIFYEQGNFKAAEQAFRQSIKIQPDAVFSYANLSAALLSQDRSAEAMQVLQQGLQIRPSAWLYSNLGNALFMREDYVGAVAAFEAAVSTTKGNPNDYLGWADLADTLLWIPGREAEARTSYQHAINLLSTRLVHTPNNEKMLSQMALYLARVGNRSECETLLQKVLKLAPDDAYVHFRAGLAYELIGNRSKALESIARARHLGFPAKFIETTPELVGLRKDPGYLKIGAIP